MTKPRKGNADQTFGQAFGALIREKRGQEGLTQKALAIQAFDDESKVRRINDIENGAVRSPQAKTVDALVVALNISKEELAACRGKPLFSRSETKDIDLSRQLIENLSLRFEHDNPDAPDGELLNFLKSKAEELKVLKKRLESLDAPKNAISNQIAAANDALALGNFDEADEILASAEEIQQNERTLTAIETQSKIRSARADTALFRGDRPGAASHYRTAAEYFLGFDKARTAYLLGNSAGYIYEYERRTLSPDFSHAIELASSALQLSPIEASKIDWAFRKYQLALLQQSQGKAKNDAHLLGEAIQHCIEALDKAELEIENFDYASLLVVLGNSYLGRAQRSGDPVSTDFDLALSTFEKAAQDPRVDALQHHCYLQNSISAAYSYKSRLANETSLGHLPNEPRWR